MCERKGAAAAIDRLTRTRYLSVAACVCACERSPLYNTIPPPQTTTQIISRAWSQRNDHLPPWGGQRPLGEAAALVRLPPHLHVMPLLEAMEDGEGWIYLVFPFAEEELFEVRYIRGLIGGWLWERISVPVG